jgi:signal transduction histidine kinase
MPLRRKIRSGYIVAFVLLMISYFFIFQYIWKVQREYNWVSDSYRAENKVGELRTAITDAETSVREYYITKHRASLKRLQQSQENIPAIFNELKILETKNPTQLAKLDTLNYLSDTRLALMERNIDAFQKAGLEFTTEIETNRQRGQVILDSIRLYADLFITAEEKLMAERKEKLTGFFNGTQIITIISLLTAILAIIYSLITYNKESKARDESTKKNIKYQKELENNIAELKRMDAEVRELKSLEKFTATGRIARTIAHEVRNPLTNISLAAEQLQEMASQNSESSMLLDMIGRNAVRINQLVADLLNATKAIQLNIKRVSINKVLDDTLELAADRIDLNQVKVFKHYSNIICGVSVDEEKIKVAFLNIIVNAIEAMEKNKGVLHLRTSVVDHKCLVEIEDNGAGMDDDTLQKLFEPYFTNKPNGNGLGLTNTQNIILSHRGKITVKSKKGEGTVFNIYLDIDET